MVKSAGEFGFQHFNRGQAGIERFGQGAEELVFGHAHGFLDAEEGIFGLAPGQLVSDLLTNLGSGLLPNRVAGIAW